MPVGGFNVVTNRRIWSVLIQCWLHQFWVTSTILTMSTVVICCLFTHTRFWLSWCMTYIYLPHSLWPFCFASPLINAKAWNSAFLCDTFILISPPLVRHWMAYLLQWPKMLKMIKQHALDSFQREFYLSASFAHNITCRLMKCVGHLSLWLTCLIVVLLPFIVTPLWRFFSGSTPR